MASIEHRIFSFVESIGSVGVIPGLACDATTIFLEYCSTLARCGGREGNISLTTNSWISPDLLRRYDVRVDKQGTTVVRQICTARTDDEPKKSLLRSVQTEVLGPATGEREGTHPTDLAAGARNSRTQTCVYGRAIIRHRRTRASNKHVQ
jgi:hypothetical protein